MRGWHLGVKRCENVSGDAGRPSCFPASFDRFICEPRVSVGPSLFEDQHHLCFLRHQPYSRLQPTSPPSLSAKKVRCVLFGQRSIICHGYSWCVFVTFPMQKCYSGTNTCHHQCIKCLSLKKIYTHWNFASLMCPLQIFIKGFPNFKSSDLIK